MRLSQSLLVWYARHGARSRDALLLPVQSIVTARHLLPLARLAHELAIPVCYTLSGSVARSVGAHGIRAAFSRYATAVSTARAHRTRWTLIVVADHGHFHPLVRGGSPVVHIGHGNPSKTDPNHPDLPWEYALAPRTRRGAVAYHEIIEASDRVRDTLVANEPALAPRIRVLGRLLDDEMLRRRREERAFWLHRLGLDPRRPVLLAASTLRVNSLFGQYWEVLLPQLRALASRYQIVLCPHPSEHAMWAARLGADPVLRLLPAGVGTEQALSVAQAVVVDISSLCQKAALLGVPMVLAQCDLRDVWSRGATRQLYDWWPVWDGQYPLEPLLAQAADMDYPPAIIDWINSRPGQAWKLYGTWLRGYFASAATIAESRRPADAHAVAASVQA